MCERKILFMASSFSLDFQVFDTGFQNKGKTQEQEGPKIILALKSFEDFESGSSLMFLYKKCIRS